MTTNGTSNERQFLRVEEVADLLQITPRTVYRWLDSGKISGTKVGKSWRIPRQVVSELAGEVGEDTAVSHHTFSQGEHLLALAPEREAVPGMMARLAEIGLQQRYRLFAGCWSFAPDELRGLMRTLGIPTDVLEAEGALEIVDFDAVFAKGGADGVLAEWRRVVNRKSGENGVSGKEERPLLAIGAPSLDCWTEYPEQLVEFEMALDELWHDAGGVSICVYPLSDFVPERLRRLGTLIGSHTGALLWSETELMLLRSDAFSLPFFSPFA